MFRSIKIAKEVGGQPPAMPADIIRYMTRQPLDFDPGERYAYSNFGYSLLGRVIERVSGADYGQVVRSKVLAPLGIRRMKLGVTLVGGRAEHEVRYYDAKNRTGKAVMGPVGEQVPLPYGAWCLEAMDAHGGWIASAVDMVRFAAAFDSPSRCRILSADGVGTMFERPADAAGHDAQGKPKDVYYACGWNVRRAGKDGRNTWHTGSLDGTSTLLVRRTDGLDWAVMFNCRDGAGGKQIAGAIDPLVHKAADAVADWPRVDHFNKWL
jgi:N-acyl-D-amino-acid deacylase